MYRAMMDVLDSVTLEDLAARVKEKQNRLTPMYYV